MKRKYFLRSSPLAYLAVPLVFAVLSLGVLALIVKTIAGPYLGLASWFMSNSAVSTQPQDLMAQASELMEHVKDGDSIPLSSITYPSEGDRYGHITISGTTVDAPVYYGDNSTILNQGVGTYKDSYGVGIPGEGKTILLAGHNNTFFNDLQSIKEGAVVTIETYYGVYTYTVKLSGVYDYRDTTSYDFTRTDENLIMYTCYPFDALGFTPERYFVYASYTSGPVLEQDQ